jgi:hypothetical protein
LGPELNIRTSHIMALIPLAAMAMRIASAPTANLSYLVIAAYALLGRAQAIQALALSWLFTMLSGGLAPSATGASIGRYAVIAAAALSILLRIRQGNGSIAISTPVFFTVVLGALLVIHSLYFSPMVDVSILKALSWTVVVATLLSAWSGLTDEGRKRLEHQLFGGLIILVLASLPFAFTATGYLRNGTGFQGVLSHPQAFGPMVAFLGGWLAGQMLGSPRPRWRDAALLGLCVVLVVMSEARTAGLALVLGVVTAVLVSSSLSGIPVRQLIPGLASRRLHALALISAMGVVLAGPMLSDRLGTYFKKRSDSANLLEAAEASRGGLVDRMTANIGKHPLTGIGFGIASDPATMQVDRDPLLGLPTGAAIEKGVLPVAVAEELGVFGLLLVLAWLWMLARRGARSGVVALSVLGIVLLTNFGESTLFSPGGVGLLPLILLTWAVTGRHHYLRRRSGV